MRTWLIYLFVFLSGFNIPHNNAGALKWVVMSGGSLKVDGSTNVNHFTCAITNYSKPDTIHVTRSNNSSVKLNGAIRLDVKNFDCHNKPMTDELRKILKEKVHPKLMIKFVSLNQYPEPNTKHKIINGIVFIELAGVTKKYEVHYKVINADNTHIHLVGTREVLFTDFNITPPKKLGGMIRTNDKLQVEFNVKMKVID